MILASSLCINADNHTYIVAGHAWWPGRMGCIYLHYKTEICVHLKPFAFTIDMRTSLRRLAVTATPRVSTTEPGPYSWINPDEAGPSRPKGDRHHERR